MAEIDWPRFAVAVNTLLGVHQLSYDRAVAQWPQLNKGLLSRACNARALSAGNYVLLCGLLKLAPDAFLLVETSPRVSLAGILKTHSDQSVTARVPRETGKTKA